MTPPRTNAFDRRAGGELRIHAVNPPEMKAEYAIRPAELARALADVARDKDLALTVTESDDPSAVTPEMRAADVLVGFLLPHARIAELPRLRWIHLTSAGADHLLPLDWLPRHVALTNSSGVHAEHAGHYALCALLMLNIGVPGHLENQRRGIWDQVFHSPIEGKTLVLVGVGAIGAAVARQAKRLGLRVVGVRRSHRPRRQVDEMVGPGELDAVLPRADFLVVTAPLTPATRGMIGRRQLDLLRPQAGVVCMSRAGLVDYDALARKLERGELRGAVVDVCDPEPLPPSAPLWAVPRLIVTPHISSDPPDYAQRVIAVLARNVRRFADGRPLFNRVRPADGY